MTVLLQDLEVGPTPLENQTRAIIRRAARNVNGRSAGAAGLDSKDRWRYPFAAEPCRRRAAFRDNTHAGSADTLRAARLADKDKAKLF